MNPLSSATLYDIETVLLAIAVIGIALAAVIRHLGRTRPGFAVGAPVAVGVAIRLLALAAVAITGLGATLRGPDEIGFVMRAHELADTGISSGLWLPRAVHRLHELVFALQIKLDDAPEIALRVTQVGIAMLGIVLIVAAVYDLAGPAAARLAGWVLVLEPAGIFFNSILHREPLLVLASGMVVLGGTRVWARLDLRGLVLLGVGCAIAVATRPYAGWFLIAAGLAIILHVSLRQMHSRMRSMVALSAVAIVAIIAAPSALALTSQDDLLQRLQYSQDANTDPVALWPGAGNNLNLEHVDLSTPAAVVRNLPLRIRDVTLRPYPWQLENTSQRLGALDTIVVYLALGLLVHYAVMNGRRTFALCAPVFYPASSLLVAYALSVGNAGTGFRYRTHLVVLGLAALVVLRDHARARTPAQGVKESGGRGETDRLVARARRDASTSAWQRWEPMES